MHTPKEQEVLDYLVRQERMNFKQSGKAGIYPNTRQVELVFNISRQRANTIVNVLMERLEKNLRQI